MLHAKNQRKGMSATLLELLDACLCVEPLGRPSIERIVSSPWMTGDDSSMVPSKGCDFTKVDIPEPKPVAPESPLGESTFVWPVSTPPPMRPSPEDEPPRCRSPESAAKCVAVVRARAKAPARRGAKQGPARTIVKTSRLALGAANPRASRMLPPSSVC